jgi:hypothetical protein
MITSNESEPITKERPCEGPTLSMARNSEGCMFLSSLTSTTTSFRASSPYVSECEFSCSRGSWINVALSSPRALPKRVLPSPGKPVLVTYSVRSPFPPQGVRCVLEPVTFKAPQGSIQASESYKSNPLPLPTAVCADYARPRLPRRSARPRNACVKLVSSPNDLLLDPGPAEPGNVQTRNS